jgi:hypothetical protein
MRPVCPTNASSANYVSIALDKSTGLCSDGRDTESSDHFKNGDLIREESAMAHGMTVTMDLMMILMMIAMAGFALAFGARKVRAAARRVLGASRGPAAGLREEGGD